MARTFSGRRSFVSNPNPSIQTPNESIERSLARNFPTDHNVENDPMDFSDNPMEHETLYDRNGTQMQEQTPNYVQGGRRFTEQPDSFSATDNFESSLSFNPTDSPLGNPFQARMGQPDLEKLQSEKNIIQSEMARIREEQRIENRRMLSEPELLAKSEKYRFLRERLDSLQQETADFQKSDSVMPNYAQSQTIEPIRTAQRSFSRITNESPFDTVSSFEAVKTQPMSTSSRVMGTPLENSMFDPNFKVGDVFKSATLGTEIELVAKGLKAGYARTPTGATVGLRSNGQQLGKEETKKVQGIYNYQNLIMKENQKQLSYFKDLTEGKIGLAGALLNPRTKQEVKGKDTRNLGTFLSERGFDTNKPFQIPDSIFKPEKQTTARTQARKGSNMGNLQSKANPYYRIEDLQRKNQFMDYEVEDTLTALQSYADIKASPLNNPRQNIQPAKPRIQQTMGQAYSPMVLEAGEFVKGSQTVFQEYYDTFDSARQFFAGEYDKSDNNYVTTTLTDLLHSTGTSLETSMRTNKPLWETMSSEYGNFIEKQSNKSGSRIAGELVTEGGIILATIGIGAGVGLATRGFKSLGGISKFFSSSMQPTVPSMKPRPKPPTDVFKFDTALGMDSKSVGLGRGISKLGNKQKKKVESALNGDKSIVDDFNKSITDMEKKSGKRFWRSFEEPKVQKGDKLIGTKGTQQIQKQKPQTKTKQQTKQETKQLTETQKGNLQYSQQLQKNLKKQKRKQPQAFFPLMPLKPSNQLLRQLEGTKAKQKPLRAKPPILRPLQKQTTTKPTSKAGTKLMPFVAMPPMTATRGIYPPIFFGSGAVRRKPQSKTKSKRRGKVWQVPDVDPLGVTSVWTGTKDQISSYWGKKSQLGRGWKFAR